MWPRAADEFTVYKKGRAIRPCPISDRKRYLLQLLTDPYRVAQFTVMRRSLSTAIDRGALSLSKWAEFPTAVSTAVYRGIPFADIPVQRGGAGRRRRRIQRLLHRACAPRQQARPAGRANVRQDQSRAGRVGCRRLGRAATARGTGG